MLAINEAQQVKSFVNRNLFNDEEILSLEDAANMQPIPGTRHKGGSYTILAMQDGDLTILVWVQYVDGGFHIKKADTQAW